MDFIYLFILTFDNLLLELFRSVFFFFFVLCGEYSEYIHQYQVYQQKMAPTQHETIESKETFGGRRKKKQAKDKDKIYISKQIVSQIFICTKIRFIWRNDFFFVYLYVPIKSIRAGLFACCVFRSTRIYVRCCVPVHVKTCRTKIARYSVCKDKFKQQQQQNVCPIQCSNSEIDFSSFLFIKCVVGIRNVFGIRATRERIIKNCF